MRTRLRGVIVLAVAVVVVAGCGGPAKPPASQDAATAGPGAAASTAEASQGVGGGSAGLVSAVLGTATYTADTARRVEAPYADDGQPVTLSAEDASGATWTVTVPAGALPRPDTIAMTPLSTIDARLPGPVIGGVLLEPEGTAFLAPVTVSVTGGHGILHGAADGTVTFALPGAGGWGSAVLWHFSPTFSFTPDDPVWLPSVREAAEATGRAMAEARELLKSKDTKLPSVPKIPWECRDDAGWKSADKAIATFVDELRQPEGAIIDRLLAGAKMAQLVGLKADGVMEMAGTLEQRLGDKAVKLLKETTGQPEKLLPVLRAVLKIGSEMGALSLDNQNIIAAIGPWAETSLDPVVRAIREEHDYAQAAVAWEIGRTVELFAGKGMVDKIEARLKPVLRFKADLKLHLYHPASLGSLIDARLGAVIPMEYEGAGSSRMIVGSALGDYLSVKWDEPNVAYETPSFPVEASLLGVDSCAGTAAFVVDTFGSPDETKVYTDDGHRFVVAYAESAFPIRFGKYYSSEPVKGVAFPVKLRNKSATWIDQSFDSTDNNEQTGSFEIVLTHTPG